MTNLLDIHLDWKQLQLEPVPAWRLLADPQYMLLLADPQYMRLLADPQDNQD